MTGHLQTDCFTEKRFVSGGDAGYRGIEKREDHEDRKVAA